MATVGRERLMEVVGIHSSKVEQWGCSRDVVSNTTGLDALTSASPTANRGNTS
jgi:hypothetical protein